MKCTLVKAQSVITKRQQVLLYMGQFEDMYDYQERILATLNDVMAFHLNVYFINIQTVPV